MKKALIDSLGRICQVENTELFIVQHPQKWVDCADICEAYQWVYINGSCIPGVSPGLAEVKTVKLEETILDRDKACTTNISAHNREWQGDPKSQSLLANEILTVQAGVPMSPVWRDSDNNNMPLTNIQQLIDIAAAFKLQTLNAYQTSWDKKAAIEAATTLEELALV